MAIRKLRKRGVPTIIPAKKFSAVRNEFTKYLRNQRSISEPYLFVQNAKQYPRQSSVLVNLALVGHNDIGAAEIKKQYFCGKISYDEAFHQISGFFTSLSP